MASPQAERTNGPHNSSTKDAAQTSPLHRHVLGDVSPNVRAASHSPAFLRRAQVGSPLKRSFTAAMEGGDGFMYLKKRKLSEDEVVSEAERTSEEIGRGGSPPFDPSPGGFRPLFSSATNDPTALPVPTIAEASPTEANTPTEPDDSTQDSSAERRSFSSLINYDPSSQTSNLLFKAASNAELLKLHLRVAMYKVRTNQIGIPFDNLLVEEERSRATSKPSSATVEQAVEELRREAQEINARHHAKSVPQLLPAPVLKPTAYSSRMIYDSPSRIPSSPPVSISPDRLPIANISTPQRDAGLLNSPPSSKRHRFPAATEQELTSSVVKGRVAEGLLGLRNAA